MKNTIIFFIMAVAVANAQNVTITPEGITPLTAASEYQRLNYDDIMALPSPEAGDMAYDLTFKCMRFYNGNQWTCSYKSPYVNEGEVALISTYGGPGLDSSADLIYDEDGNIFTTGYYTDSLIIGDTLLHANNNTQDIYLAKFTKDGNLVWAISSGGSGFDLPTAIHFDQNGDLLMTGLFNETTNFQGTTITSEGSYDGFLAKFTEDGDLIWLKSFGGLEFDSGISLDTDNSNNIYIAGNYTGTATFDAVSKTSQDGQDIFLAKYNDLGVLQWIASAGGTNTDRVIKVMLANDNKILLLGEFQNDISFGSLSETSDGFYDIFKVMYDPIALEWDNLSRYGSSGDVSLAHAEIDSSNNLYLAGSFKNTLTIGPFSKSSEGDFDLFAAKVLANGSVSFLKSFGSEYLDKNTSMVVNNKGEIFLSGYFSQTGNFEGIQKLNNGIYDIYIMKLLSTGSLSWVHSFGGTGAELNRKLTKNNEGDIFGTGSFESNFYLGNSYVTKIGSGSDIYMFRLQE